MKEEWSHVLSVRNGTVIIAHDSHFMGPVLIVVPLRCATMKKWHRRVDPHTSTAEPPVETIEVAAPPAHETEALSVPLSSTSQLPTKGYLHSLRHTLNPPIEVNVCGKTQYFEAPRLWNLYLSMVTLSRKFGWATPTTEDLWEARMNLFDSIFFWIVACLLMKHGMKTYDVVTRLCGPQVELSMNSYRTRADKVLESLLLHSLSI